MVEDRIYYRAGDSNNPLGQYFVDKPPMSQAQVRIDTAVKRHWTDPVTGAHKFTSDINTVYKIKVPKGTTVFKGPVGPQGAAYCGGSNIMQIFIETPWKLKGIEVLGKTPLN